MLVVWVFVVVLKTPPACRRKHKQKKRNHPLMPLPILHKMYFETKQ